MVAWYDHIVVPARGSRNEVGLRDALATFPQPTAERETVELDASSNGRREA
ncbi:MAG: hypothetical protein H0T42_31985 [Deltaproteobacteria bacterium]|nr:hypothetical protein [Deltaproteobacteria bacterium]